MRIISSWEPSGFRDTSRYVIEIPSTGAYRISRGIAARIRLRDAVHGVKCSVSITKPVSLELLYLPEAQERKRRSNRAAWVVVKLRKVRSQGQLKTKATYIRDRSQNRR